MRFERETLCRIVIAAIMILVAACAERAAENTVAVVQDPDLVLGKQLFASCALCHTTSAGAESAIGPNLAGILGSAAGSKTDFVYSESLKSSGIIWTEESLERYVESPATYLPGGSMGFVGIADEGDRRAVLAYLIDKTNNDSADSSIPSDQGEDVAIWE